MVLPTFAIVGTQKGGTTSLMRFVSRHPQVGRPVRKEVHFFDRHYRLGLEWYSEQFSLNRGQTHVGDATPLYMYDPEVRDRMIAALPDIRILVTLRDPVARAYSHYWHSRRYRREELASFEEAIAAEPERLADASMKQRAHWSYVDRGRYVGQLEALERAYGRDAMCVITLEQMIADPAGQITQVLDHLGLDVARMPSLTMPQSNAYSTITPKERRRRLAEGEPLPDDTAVKYPPIDPATRDRLRAGYAEDDAALLRWLGWEALPWRTDAAA